MRCVARVARDRECHCSLNRVVNLAYFESRGARFSVYTSFTQAENSTVYFQIALLCLSRSRRQRAVTKQGVERERSRLTPRTRRHASSVITSLTGLTRRTRGGGGARALLYLHSGSAAVC